MEAAKSTNTDQPSRPATEENKTNWLPSAQWKSESTVWLAAAAAAASPAPCDKCKVEFTKSEVTVQWSDSAEGNSYNASSNLVSNDEWTPDSWSITPKPNEGATIDSSGIVTFGKLGQTVTITAGVKRCPKCKKSFTLNIVRLRIEYTNPDSPIPGVTTDVTDETTDVEVGNFIELSVLLQPSALAPTDGYKWTIPDKVLKNYKADAAANPIVKLDDYAVKKISFHWLDDGEKKCEMNVPVKGLAMTAKTTFSVSRPTAAISGVIGAPQGVNLGPGQEWKLKTAFMKFTRDAFEGGSNGKTCWTQVLDYDKSIGIREGQIIYENPPAGISSGLDAEFQYSSDQSSMTDAASIGPAGNTNNVNWLEDSIDCTLYLMYKSSQKESRWVPLRSIFWQARANASIIGPLDAPKANYQLDASSFQYVAPSDEDEFDPPTWERIIE